MRTEPGTIERLFAHYLKNAIVNARQVRACVDNRASKELLLSEIDRLIGFLQGGYDFIVCRKEGSHAKRKRRNAR